jgi:hypothetical protein
MQIKYLTDVLSGIDMTAEMLCDIDPDWERSSIVKRGIRAMLNPCYEILQEKAKTSEQFTSNSFSDVF